jgi:hypothetical protein
VSLRMAQRVRPSGKVYANDIQPAMLDLLRRNAAKAGIGNVRTVEARWPIGRDWRGGPSADVSLIANVGHDVEGIGDFLDAMEAATRRLCVAVMPERQPASSAEPFWPPLHRESRIPLPALPELLALLRARGRRPEPTMVEQPRRDYPDEAALAEFLRRQLWIAPGGTKVRRLLALIRADLVEADGGVGLRSEEPRRVGVVHWEPR